MNMLYVGLYDGVHNYENKFNYLHACIAGLLTILINCRAITNTKTQKYYNNHAIPILN